MEPGTSLMRKLCLALILAATVGCVDMGRPNWTNPGTAGLQELRAKTFDPYPKTLSGSGSETIGVRPRDYDKPTLDPPAPPLPWMTRSAPRY